MQPKIGLRNYYTSIKFITRIKRVTFCDHEKTGTLLYYSVAANWLGK